MYNYIYYLYDKSAVERLNSQPGIQAYMNLTYLKKRNFEVVTRENQFDSETPL